MANEPGRWKELAAQAVACIEGGSDEEREWGRTIIADMAEQIDDGRAASAEAGQAVSAEGTVQVECPLFYAAGSAPLDDNGAGVLALFRTPQAAAEFHGDDGATLDTVAHVGELHRLTGEAREWGAVQLTVDPTPGYPIRSRACMSFESFQAANGLSIEADEHDQQE